MFTSSGDALIVVRLPSVFTMVLGESKRETFRYRSKCKSNIAAIIFYVANIDYVKK